jgi:type 1 glutamine amidotransferase
MNAPRRIVIAVAVCCTTAMLVVAQAPAGRGGRGRGGPPILSVRTNDSRHFRVAADAIMGWKVGISANVLGPVTFSEAAAKVDALGVANITGFSGQNVSAAIPKPLNFNLSPDELAAVRNRLTELRLKMPAYRLQSGELDRKVFEFGKTLAVETIIANVDAASLPSVERLADEFSINVALEGAGKDPHAIMALLAGRGKRIGVSADLGSWMEAGIKPAEGLALFRERLMALELRDRSALGLAGRDVPLGAGVGEVSDFMRQANRIGLKPSVMNIGSAGGPERLAQSVEASEQILQPALGDAVDQISRNAAITSYDKLPQEIRAGIEAAVPRKPLATPKKPRKLLVLDENVNAYVHNTIPHGNFALAMMAKYTAAFEPVFSNDLDNLKYPRIKEFDAIFLNSAGGMIFVDPQVREGIMRYVREGGGLSGIHAASYASLEWPEFTELIGAGDGPHRVEKVTLKIDDPNSPLNTPFEGRTGFVWVDEFYHFPPTGPYSRDKLHVLFSIDAQKTDLSPWPVRPDNDYGMSWIKSYGKGRVFYCALGHTPLLFLTPALSEHILAGIQFALGDLDADTTPSARLAQKLAK